jgi:hypothetical protein
MMISAKLTFSLIAITALLISGSAFLDQKAFAVAPADWTLGVPSDPWTKTAGQDPQFTAYHLNTTATVIKFTEAVNGTMVIKDWGIRFISTATAGDISYDVDITDVNNGTAPSTLNKSQSSVAGLVGLGNMNDTTTLYLIHDAIPSNVQYFVNYTQDPESAVTQGKIVEAHELGARAALNHEELLIGSNATAADHMPPTVLSALIHQNNANQVKLTMSEPVANVNSTGSGFSITRTHGAGSDNIPTTISITNGSSYIYVDFNNRANPGDVLSISFATTAASDNWITDAIATKQYGIAQSYEDGVGNRLVNFTGATLLNDQTGRVHTNLAVNIVNWLQIGSFGDVTTCYDCAAPTVTDVKVSLDSSIPIKVTNDNQVHINAGIGDTVSVMVTVDDNLGADTIPFAGLYTNFGATPDNLYYSNNFDSAKQMSTSYYEWNVRNDDIAFDNDGAITWTDATAKVNADRTQTFTYTMTINDSIESSQVWVDIGDKVGNYAKLSLPITLEVSGAPGLTFASDDTQKVVSFFNESILLAIVSQWTATSSDDASNVEQLSSVLGIESQLPTWTTELASWVADDKIDVADMIVAVEYVINL